MKYQKEMFAMAEGAGKILLKYFTKVRNVERKKNAGIVTEADKLAEKYILKQIDKQFPGSSILAEESGAKDRKAEMKWIIDPLDGTSNYAHGFPWFCVSIAVYEESGKAAGMVYHPLTKETFFAATGQGAFLNGRKIKVSKTKTLKDSLLGTGFYYSKGEQLREECEIFRRVNEVALGVRRPGSAALDLAFVAAGRYDGFWERGLSAWDVAAGFLLVQEAGGKISDYHGKPTDLFRKEVIASNGLLHRQMVARIRG